MAQAVLLVFPEASSGRSHLVQLEAHPDGRRHHLLQQVHVGEHPLVLGGDAEVPLEQRVEAVQERLEAGDRGEDYTVFTYGEEDSVCYI